MRLTVQVVGLNAFLKAVYGEDKTIGNLLGNAGFNSEQIDRLLVHHLAGLVQALIDAVKQGLQRNDDGERLYFILSRRYSFDGAPAVTLQTIADQYGITRERVRQLERNGINFMRSEAARQQAEKGLEAAAMALVGPPKDVPQADDAQLNGWR